MREKHGSFGREDAIARIPPVVAAVPRVNVPLAVVGVPVHVDDAGTLVSGPIRITITAVRVLYAAVSDAGPRSPPDPDTN